MSNILEGCSFDPPASKPRWKIGSAGVPNGVKNNAEAVIAMREDFNLDAYEIQATRNLNYSDSTISLIMSNAYACNISISLHAELFTTLLSSKKATFYDVRKYVGNALLYAEAMNVPVIIHPGGDYWGPEQLQLAINNLKLVFFETRINPAYAYLEVMGKHKMFGRFSELFYISQELGTRICLDLAHLWASVRGKYGIFPMEYLRYILETLEKTPWKYEMLFHMSGMIHNRAGEVKHTKLQSSGLPWLFFLKEILSKDLSGRIILESGKEDASDAQFLKETIEYLSE